MDRVALESFIGTSDERRYREYRRIKFQTFVREQGWAGLGGEASDGLADEDRFDGGGRFALARTTVGDPVGVVRCLPLTEGFPHSELFRHHILQEEVADTIPSLATLNALAVLPEYRGRAYEVLCDGRIGTVCRLLLLEAMFRLAREGVKGILATVQSIISARALMRVGFRLIDKPATTPLHERFPLANVGIVLGSTEHVAAAIRCGVPWRLKRNHTPALLRLEQYFDRQQRAVLRSASLQELFRTR